MAATNVQAFSGDVEVASNLAVDTNTLFVDSVGDKVGIGITNPAEKLRVIGTTHSDQFITGGGQYQSVVGAAGNLRGMTINNTNVNFGSGAEIELKTGDSYSYKIAQTTQGGGVGNLLQFFGTPGNSTTHSEIMRLGNDGGTNRISLFSNVGIGTNNPLELLDIAKSGSDNFIRIQAGGITTRQGGIQFTEDNIRYGWRQFYDASTDNLHFSTQDNNNDITSNVMVMKTNGNVGIGTTDPEGKLDIEGVLVANDSAEPNRGILIPDGAGDSVNLNGYSVGDSKAGVAQFVSEQTTDDNLPSVSIINKDRDLNTTKNANIGFFLTDSVGTGKYAGRIGFWPESADAITNQFRIYTTDTDGETQGAGYAFPTQRMVVTGAGNVGIGTDTLVAAGPKLQIYADGNGNDNPGGGITLMRSRASDSDLRSSSIFSMAVGSRECLVFNMNSATNSYVAGPPHIRMKEQTSKIPYLEIVEGQNTVNFSNVFIQSTGSIGRHYQNLGGTNFGSSIHFSADYLYPADYAGTINNDVINFGAPGNRWKNIYTKLVEVDDATGYIRIGDGTASHHHSMTIQRATADGAFHLLVGDTSGDNGSSGYISFGNNSHGVARNGRGQKSTRFANTTDANDVMLFTAGNGGAWLINGSDEYLGINTEGTGILNGNTIATTSDRRIKKDIEDIDDVSALEKLRLLMPKTYKYKDKKLHDQRVYGFIAQEVGEVLPYATSLRDNIIPNIQEFGIVTDSNVITFTSFNTNDLESNTNGLVAISRYDSALDDLQRSYVNLVEVIDEHSIRVDKNVEDLAYSLDGEGNVITEVITTTLTQEEYDDLNDKSGYEADGNVYSKSMRTHVRGDTLYVFGQNVTDFVFLDKPSIFTVATAALQEVDRQQQADKLRIGELESQFTSVLARLEALESV